MFKLNFKNFQISLIIATQHFFQNARLWFFENNSRTKQKWMMNGFGCKWC